MVVIFVEILLDLLISLLCFWVVHVNEVFINLGLPLLGGLLVVHLREWLIAEHVVIQVD